MSTHDSDTSTAESPSSDTPETDGQTERDTDLTRAVMREFFDARDYRAATEYLLVHEHPGTDGTHDVYSEDGTQRTVDIDAETGDCEDIQYNDPPEPGCKHVRRAQMEAGERPVPPDLDRAEMDPRLVERLDDGPAFQPDVTLLQTSEVAPDETGPSRGE